MKILYLDVETTGFDHKRQDIVQIGALVRINNEIVDEINIKCQPVHWKTISSEALSVNKLTIEEIKTYEDPKISWKKLYDFIIKNFNDVKYIFAGQNTKFDWRFTDYWWTVHKADISIPSFDYYFKVNHLDLMVISKMFRTHKLLNVPDIKLGTIIEALNVKVDGNLHSALTDIKGTDASVIEYVHRVRTLKLTDPNHPVVKRFERLLVLV